MKNIYDTINKAFSETVVEFGFDEKMDISIYFKTDDEIFRDFMEENISRIIHQSLMDVMGNFQIGSKWFEHSYSIYYRKGKVHIYGSKLIPKYDTILRYHDNSDTSDDEFLSMLKTALRLEMGSIAHFQSFNGLFVEEYERFIRSYEESMDDFISNGSSIRDITSIPGWSEAIRISGITPEEIEKYSDILFDF